jgi:hypothetical protein
VIGGTPVDSGVSKEWEVNGSDSTPHYYAIVVWNDLATGNQVRFSLTGFPANAKNVYIRVKDSLWGGRIVHFHRVAVDGQGAASDTWTPPTESTGICIAGAGFADTTDSFVTYRDTSRKELTLEKVRMAAFDDPTQYLQIRYCQQFFQNHDSGPAHDTVLVRYADTAMLRSWRMQVDTWNLGSPPDADNVHQVFVNDTVNWYHVSAGTAAYESSNRRIALGFDPLHIDTSYTYTDEESAVQSFLAHEFFHGVQYGLSQDKWLDSTWNWFTEGQARFLQSAQSQTEEFLTARRLYPRDANRYLTRHLNTSLVTLSGDTVMKANGYPYCLFWRFMFERYKWNGTKDAVQLVRDCYAESVGPNSIAQGKVAIDSAMAKWQRSHPPDSVTAPTTTDNFLRTLDDFAVACYLNDTAFHLWSPNPPGVYAGAHLTLNDSFLLGPSATDSIVLRDGIDCSYGIDLDQVKLNGDVDTLLVSCSLALANYRQRLVRVYPASPRDTFVVDTMPILTVPRFSTAGAKRVCLVLTRHDTLDAATMPYKAVFNVKRAVAVEALLPRDDTAAAGSQYTPKAVVANHGWIKQTFLAVFRIGASYTGTDTCTIEAGGRDTIAFTPWSATEGDYPTSCSVYVAKDADHADDTLRGSLAVVALEDTWVPREPVAGGAGNGAALAAVGDTCIYALRGNLSGDFRCYDVRSDTWTTRESLPAIARNGASLAWDRGAYIYALRGSATGNKHRQLYRYDIAGNAWDTLPSSSSLPGSFGQASALVWGDGYLYALEGLLPDSAKGFFRYDTATRQWESKGDPLDTCGFGSCLCWSEGNYIYAFRGDSDNTFLQYDIGADNWYPAADFPSWVFAGGALTYMSQDIAVYGWSGMFGGAYTAFCKYHIDGDSWSWRSYPPAKVGYGGALATCNGNIYGLRGSGYADFWQYYPGIPFRRPPLAGVDDLRGLVTTNSFAVSPSPARGPVRLQWQVKEAGPMAVKVFDNTGRVVRTIQNGDQAAGRYSAQWNGICDNGRRAASGVFFYRIDAPGFRKIVKVVTVDR